MGFGVPYGSCRLSEMLTMQPALFPPGDNQRYRQTSHQQIREPRQQMMDRLEGFANHGEDMEEEPRRAQVRERHAEQRAPLQWLQEIEIRTFVAGHTPLLSGAASQL